MVLKQIGVLVLLSSALISEAGENNHTLKAETQRFLTALLSKDERVLVAFEDDGPFFSDGVHLNPDIYNFLYRPVDNQSHSIIDITKQGRLSIKILPQVDNSFIAVFYPRKFKKQVDTSLTFLKTEWMEKYFACAFRWSNGRLVLHHNFCFAETDGPFPKN